VARASKLPSSPSLNSKLTVSFTTPRNPRSSHSFIRIQSGWSVKRAWTESRASAGLSKPSRCERRNCELSSQQTSQKTRILRAVLIAMAQGQREEFLHVYSASISSKFLDKLETPSCFVPATQLRSGTPNCHWRAQKTWSSNCPTSCPRAAAEISH
jgi:hypothetical protein